MAIRNAVDAFGGSYIPFEGPIDTAYLLDIPNEDVARRALNFLDDRVNEVELHKRHSPQDIERMWRGVFRACLGHSVPLREDQKAYAKQLGIVLPG
ncbi:MAG TPA: hypothetical protein VIK52_11070 [Opitutaceae bacterium]